MVCRIGIYDVWFLISDKKSNKVYNLFHQCNFIPSDLWDAKLKIVKWRT